MFISHRSLCRLLDGDQGAWRARRAGGAARRGRGGLLEVGLRPRPGGAVAAPRALVGALRASAAATVVGLAFVAVDKNIKRSVNQL